MRKLIGFWIVIVATILLVVFGRESEQETARRIQENERDAKIWAQGITDSIRAQNETFSRFVEASGITALEFAEIQRKLDEKEKNKCKQ